ncbi:aminopeptidase N [Glaciecola sp. 2405UD65-10]|uniref:aminopeptidase N n=1 Tax=Glaciecola sp. 2405UD65-10 TaxID=3397244 RepID=UPI003B5B6F1C
MSTSSLSKKRLDYKASTHLISQVNLQFDLSLNETLVSNTMQISRNKSNASRLFLDGENLNLVSASIDGNLLSENTDYELLENGLCIYCDLENFELTIKTSIDPQNNTSLEGLYYSNKAFCTQCEAEGFRKISYFLDRPDVLSIYTVAITSNDPSLTYLLSNGNLISDSGMVNGKRTCVWHDPHPKPAYLFALVAGHFDRLEDEYTTLSGKNVKLELFVDEGRLDQGQHALDSLKKAMKWDEETYSLEYDLDIYMVVAVDFFNMGAMENKGLNVFNSKYVLANSNTATDTDYFNIESIIAHEYFHNWTGNRVTCRDWFQLSLKEGLTVFRDQQFSADMFSYLSTRISQVKVMQEHQFAEDASPMSHPIRPDEVMEMNNFYTVTVYDKGAEVIRMLHTLLGPSGFKRGMDLYFSRHDGCAVTCDDFVSAMQDANSTDLSHFKRWYSQSGTPQVSVKQTIDVHGNTLLNFTQTLAPTADQAIKELMYIPIKLECFSENGDKLNTGLENDTLILTEQEHTIVLKGLDSRVSPSLLQDFSAPVIVHYDYSNTDLINIIENTDNDYAKWDAYQRFFYAQFKLMYARLKEIGDVESSVDVTSIKESVAVMAQVLTTLKLDKSVLAALLAIPSVESCMAHVKNVEPQIIIKAHDALSLIIADALSPACKNLYHENINSDSYRYEKEQVNQRALKSACLHILARSNFENVSALIKNQYDSCDNMTDKISALQAAQIVSDFYCDKIFNELMISFESQFNTDAVVMDKWFSMHATSRRHDILSQLDLLQSHQHFSNKNPNKVRALVGSFAFYNTQGFHAEDGSGYKYLSDYLIELDKINPQVASRLITPLIQLDQYGEQTRELMTRQLERIFAQEKLSKDLFEKISKCLVRN